MSGGSHNYISSSINGALFEHYIDTHYRNICCAKNTKIATKVNK